MTMPVFPAPWWRRLTTLAVAAFTLAAAGCASSDPIVIVVQPLEAGGIRIDAGESEVRWFCAIYAEDPTLCRGRLDGHPTLLRFMGEAPLAFVNDSLMLYRRQGRIVGLALEPQAGSVDQLKATWSPLIHDAYDTSALAGRACSKTTAADAIERAEPFFNARQASICADVGLMQIDWKFASATGNDARTRLLSLTIWTPGLPGNKAWWLS